MPTGGPRHAPRPLAWAVALGLCCAALPTGAAQAASALVPLDHPAYPRIEAWAARGVIATPPAAIRPITWERVLGLLDGAVPVTDRDRARLAALRAEARTHTEPPGRAELTLQGAWARGDAPTFPTVPAVASGPALDDNGGRRVTEPGGLSAELRLERPGRRVAVTLAPRVTAGHAGGGNPAWQEGYVLADAGPVVVSAGRQPLQWGPARHGGFLLTPNAAPLPALRLTGSRPFGLPARLGSLEFDLFAARLEADRVVPHPILGGVRLEWRPAGTWRIGLARVTMLGGEGQPALSGGDLLTILTGKNLYGDADTSNSIAGVDVAVLVPNPFAAGRLRLYGEYAGEDEARLWPTKPAVRGGLLVPGLGADGATALRAEFAATDVFYDHIKWGSIAWYRHGVYRSGYTYRGTLIGDAMGPDARDARLWLTRDGAGRTELEMGWRASYFSAPDRVERWRLAATRAQDLTRRTAIQVRAAVERRTGGGPVGSGWDGMLTVTLSTATGMADGG
ncbi:MAG: hypothetical protein HZA24_12565 [Nitrospirae bacterium]|nr:hypothetical protein [Nitrospirota bacterium]